MSCCVLINQDFLDNKDVADLVGTVATYTNHVVIEGSATAVTE